MRWQGAVARVAHGPSLQSSPEKPSAQLQRPWSQRPWPEQSLGQVLGVLQSPPSHAPSQKHLAWKHFPWPLQSVPLTCKVRGVGVVGVQGWALSRVRVCGSKGLRV